MEDRTTATPGHAERPGPAPRRRRRWGGSRRLAALAIAGLSVGVGLAAPAGAAMSQVRGDAVYEPDRDDGVGECKSPPMGFDTFTSIDPLVLRGDLEGCLWTLAEPGTSKPSGVYLEQGMEVFEGTYLGGERGTFVTTYRFEAKYDVDGNEIFGRCQHPIVEGSGTGGFEGVSGRIFFKDAPPEFFYRGHLTFG